MPTASLGDVSAFRLGPAGDPVLYLADGEVDGSNELYARSLDTQVTTRLSTRQQSFVRPDFHLDPTGRHALFRVPTSGTRWLTVPVDGSQAPRELIAFERFSADGAWVLHLSPGFDQRGDLFSQPTDASAFARSLTGTFRNDKRILQYEPTADAARVVLVGNLRRGDRFELYTVPVDGSTPFASLSGSLGAGENVTGFELSSAGVVVYRSDQRIDETHELFRVAADGGAARERVTPDLPPGTNVGPEFRLTADGTRLVFTAELEVPGRLELFGLLLDGLSAPVKLSPPLLGSPGPSAAPADLALSPDGRFVLFRFDPLGVGASGLFAALLDGTSPAVRLDPVLAPDESVDQATIGADSRHALFLVRGPTTQLLAAALDGSAPARPVHPPLVPGGDVVSFALAGAHVVYRADQEVDERLELFRAPLDGSAPATRLHPPLAPGREVLPEFRVSADGRVVGFRADLEADEVFELFVAPADGSGPARRANDPAATAPRPVGDVRSMRVAGERALYLADQERDEVVELFSVPRDGSQAPRRLHPPAVEEGDVLRFELAPDGLTVVFSGDLERDGRVQLYAAPVDGSAPARDLAGVPVEGGSVHRWSLSPDGTRVAYAAETFVAGQAELFTVPLSGGAPLRLAPPSHRTFGSVDRLAFTPDGRQLVTTSDDEHRGHFELYGVASDGSTPARKLASVGLPAGDVHDFLVTSDSRRVVYLADQETDHRLELWGVPLDGSAPPVRLSPPLPGGGSVWRFALGADARVVFSYGRFRARRLASAPVDGSAPALDFVPAAFQHTIDFHLTPAGTRVVFRQRSSGPIELLSAPVDASAPPLAIDAPLHRTRNFQPLFPDEDTVLYYASRPERSRSGCYRTRLDGSLPPARLEAPGAPRRLSPDGRDLLVFATANRPFPDLYVVPVDGSARAHLVSQVLAPGASIAAADFAGTKDVLYIVDGGLGGVRELFGTGDARGARRSGKGGSFQVPR